jgi:hypothetical protein
MDCHGLRPSAPALVPLAGAERFSLLRPPSLAAEFFNVDVRTIQRRLAGTPCVPWIVTLLIRNMIRHDISPEEATRVALSAR